METTSATNTDSAPSPPLVDEECSVCKDVFKGGETVQLECGHYFHASCGQQWYKRQRPCRCPLCRDPFTIKAYFDEDSKPIEETEEWKRVKQEAREMSVFDNEPQELFFTLLTSLLNPALASGIEVVTLSIPVGPGPPPGLRHFGPMLMSDLHMPMPFADFARRLPRPPTARATERHTFRRRFFRAPDRPSAHPHPEPLPVRRRRPPTVAADAIPPHAIPPQPATPHRRERRKRKREDDASGSAAAEASAASATASTPEPRRSSRRRVASPRTEYLRSQE